MSQPLEKLIGPTERARIALNKTQQDYDETPPRCVTCLYYRREPKVRYVERKMKTRHGIKVRMVRNAVHATRNPLVDRCTFGDFLVKPSAVCDEWRTRDGQCIDRTPDGGSE